MKFSEFKLPLLLVPQNNSINLDVKSTGIEIKRHQGFLRRLLIDRGEGLNVKGGCACGEKLVALLRVTWDRQNEAGLCECSLKELLRFAETASGKGWMKGVCG